jgi:hypothetical protein
MKKIVSFILILFLMLGFLPASAAVNTDNAELKPLPQVGTVISGFKTIEIGNMDLINSKTAFFKHEKTGAELLFIQSKDIDRSFDITFKTPAVNDTGVNHVLEHITVSGSKKYPLKDVLFTAANQTYSTFVNAMTSQTYTTYPVSSMSEAQLLKLTDLYLIPEMKPQTKEWILLIHRTVYGDAIQFSIVSKLVRKKSISPGTSLS